MLPNPTFRMSRSLWLGLGAELHRRTEGRHESGAFLLGTRTGTEREATAVIYYDDLDPRAYATGVCVLHADAFGRLWDRCAEMSLVVVADAHVHPRGAWQSLSDRENPMIARLARHCDCAIHGVRVVRYPGHHLRLELTERLDPPRDAKGKPDVAGTMQMITDVVETWVREYPEQWLWVH